MEGWTRGEGQRKGQWDGLFVSAKGDMAAFRVFSCIHYSVKKKDYESFPVLAKLDPAGTRYLARYRAPDNLRGSHKPPWWSKAPSTDEETSWEPVGRWE